MATVIGSFELHAIGVTGRMGAGKSTICRMLAMAASHQGLKSEILDVDKIRQGLLSGTTPGANSALLRNELLALTGDALGVSDGSINRHALANLLISNPRLWHECTGLIRRGLRRELERRVKGTGKLVILEWALMESDGFLDLVDCNVLHVRCAPSLLKRRLSGTLSKDLIEARLALQRSDQDEQQALLAALDRKGCGNYLMVDGGARFSRFDAALALNHFLPRWAYAA